MSNSKITIRAIEAFRMEAQRASKVSYLWDTILPGFGVRSGKTGLASYVFQYRVGGKGGKSKRISIGKYPSLSPDAARKEAEKLKADTHNRIDVVERRREALHRQKLDLQTLSLSALVDTYLNEKREQGRYWTEVTRLFERSIIPALGPKTLITKITKNDIRRLIRSRSNRPGAARNLFASLRPFFNWCVREDYISVSPMVELASPQSIKARDRILTDDEIKAFWLATENVGSLFSPFYKLLLLTAQRREEVAGMRWNELDLENGTWTIPAARAKNSKEHIVHLSPLAIQIIDAIERKNSDFVFTTTGKTPVSGYSKAKHNLDELMAEHIEGELVPWRVHDLRRTAASGMARLGFDPHIIERVLNHLSGATGGLVSVYQRYEYLDDRRNALLAWSSFVEKLTGTSESSNKIIALTNFRLDGYG